MMLVMLASLSDNSLGISLRASADGLLTARSNALDCQSEVARRRAEFRFLILMRRASTTSANSNYRPVLVVARGYCVTTLRRRSWSM
jgi:hypothetical protein